MSPEAVSAAQSRSDHERMSLPCSIDEKLEGRLYDEPSPFRGRVVVDVRLLFGSRLRTRLQPSFDGERPCTGKKLLLSHPPSSIQYERLAPSLERVSRSRLERHSSAASPLGSSLNHVGQGRQGEYL